MQNHEQTSQPAIAGSCRRPGLRRSAGANPRRRHVRHGRASRRRRRSRAPAPQCRNKQGRQGRARRPQVHPGGRGQRHVRGAGGAARGEQGHRSQRQEFRQHAGGPPHGREQRAGEDRQRKKVELPAAPPRAMRSDIEKLGKKNGADFDRDFVREVGIKAHEKDIKMFQGASKNVKDAELKALVDKTLPKLREHLAQPRSCRARTRRRWVTGQPRGAPARADRKPAATTADVLLGHCRLPTAPSDLTPRSDCACPRAAGPVGGRRDEIRQRMRRCRRGASAVGGRGARGARTAMRLRGRGRRSSPRPAAKNAPGPACSPPPTKRIPSSAKSGNSWRRPRRQPLQARPHAWPWPSPTRRRAFATALISKLRRDAAAHAAWRAAWRRP